MLEEEYRVDTSKQKELSRHTVILLMAHAGLFCTQEPARIGVFFFHET
jgi:hypothetical protein